MFLNGTPHEIVVYAQADCIFDSSLRKFILKEESTPIYKIPAGVGLNAETKVGELKNPEFAFLKKAVEFVSADPIPGTDEIVIVSNLYRSALKELGRDTSRLATVSGAVYSDKDNPRPIGCLWLNQG
jgi:hypothetical protein